MTAKSSEEYWNTSSSISFNFDDDNSELDKASSNFNELFETSNTDNVFGVNTEDNSQIVLPMHSIITKRNLDSVLDDIRIPSQMFVPPVQETILKMFLGMPYTLYVYHTLDQKLELLDEAVATEDGNIILSVLLYLKKSIKLSILFHHLSKRKVALQHYTSYLMQELKLEELSDLYMITGNYSDILYLYYLGYKDVANKERIHIKLLRFLAEHQSKLNNDKNNMFSDYRNFIKWQMENNMSANSVIEELVNTCKTKWEKSPDNSNTNKQIVEFKQTFKISDFQYEWVQLNTLGTLKLWKKLSASYIKPNWLTKKNSIKSVINPELFVATLSKHDPPKQVLEEFLSCMVDNEVALALAKKMRCHKFVIDTYINQRDRLAILTYKEYIPSQSEEFFYAENVLHASDKRWKN